MTLTATVTAVSPSTAAVNGGTVSFYNGPALPGNLLGTSTAVVNGVASIATSALPVGASLTITAVYSGGANFLTSPGVLNAYAVTAAGTNTAVSAAPASGDVFGESVTFTATVTAAALLSTAVVNGGTVSFYDGSVAPSNLIGISGTVAAGTAAFTTSSLAVSLGHTIPGGLLRQYRTSRLQHRHTRQLCRLPGRHQYRRHGFSRQRRCLRPSGDPHRHGDRRRAEHRDRQRRHRQLSTTGSVAPANLIGTLQRALSTALRRPSPPTP